MHILPSISPSFSVSCCDKLTKGYKWHEFLSIIPPLFPLPFFPPCAVEIKDCWAKGKKDSINLLLSLTVTFTWQSCTALCEMQLLLAKALAYAPEILFLSLYSILFNVLPWRHRHRCILLNLQDHGICLVTFVTCLPLSTLSFIYSGKVCWACRLAFSNTLLNIHMVPHTWKLAITVSAGVLPKGSFSNCLVLLVHTVPAYLCIFWIFMYLNLYLLLNLK